MPSAMSYDPTWPLCLRDVSVDSHTFPTKAFINIKAPKNFNVHMHVASAGCTCLLCH